MPKAEGMKDIAVLEELWVELASKVNQHGGFYARKYLEDVNRLIDEYSTQPIRDTRRDIDWALDRLIRVENELIKYS